MGLIPEHDLLTPPAYLYRLSGGMRLIVDAEGKCQLLGANPGREAHFFLEQNKIGTAFLDYQRIRVLARTKCESDDDLWSPISDRLALRAFGPDRRCLAFGQEFYWSGVSQVLRDKNMYPEAGLVQRLVTQIRYCLRRFEKLFIAYSTFSGTLEEAKSRAGIAIWSKYTVNIGTEFCSLLEALYALRDAVNAVAYRMLFHKSTTFSSRKFKVAIGSAPQNTFVRLVQASMFMQGNGDLLLSRMSTYRSVALHCTGIANPVMKDSVILKEEIGSFGPMLRTVYPLYDDIEKLKGIERGENSLLFKDNKFEFERFVNLSTHEDALDFGFDSFVRLLTLGNALGNELHLESKHRTITGNDIISFEVGR